MDKNEKRDAAGREAYEQNLRNLGGAAQANAVRWNDLDPEAKQRWIEQAEAGATTDTADVTAVDEPAESSAEKPTAKATKSAPAKATKTAGAKADGDSV